MGVVPAAILGLFIGLTWVGLGAAALVGGLAANWRSTDLPKDQEEKLREAFGGE